jgi:mannose-1-phosphate guanylyltransferase
VTISKGSTIQPVILSGGSGTRLWPLSLEQRPKQFLKLFGDSSMFQLTLKRVSGRGGYLVPIVVGGVDHRDMIQADVGALGAEGHLILEPAPRNTAAAIALAALTAPSETPLLVMPSDHMVRHPARLLKAVEAALPVIKAGYLLTFGITPSQPYTGYGYIRRGAALAPGVFRADAFVEKPDGRTALRYLESGDYSWNAGIFLFRAGDYLAALAEHAPEILAACQMAVERGADVDGVLLPDRQAFLDAPSLSVDYAVMEKSARVAVAPIDAGWSDIGSWDALDEFVGAAERGNAGVVEIDCSGCFIRTEGLPVAAVGIQDMIIVATREGVLIVPKGRSEEVRGLVELLKEKGA